MGWVEKKVDQVFNVISDIGDVFSDVVEGVFDAVGDVLEGVGNFVEGVLKDPLPTILQIGGAMIGIPPYVTAAVITAAKGGDLEDIAKSAVVSYASANFLQTTGLQDAIKGVTSDMTSAISDGFDLPLETSATISSVITSAAGQGVVGGLNAVLTGKNVLDGIAGGFTSGLIYSGTNSFFEDANKDPNWGLSKTSLDLLKGATSTALNTIVSGKGDPSQAVANYIAYATLKMGASEIYKTAVRAYEDFTGKTELAEAAQDKYVELKAKYDSQVGKYNDAKDDISSAQENYKKIYDAEFKPIADQLTKYEDTFDAQKTVYDLALKTYEDNKWAYNNYDAKLQDLGWVKFSDSESGDYWGKPAGTYSDGEGGTYTRYSYGGEPSRQSFFDAANTAAKQANNAGAAAQVAYDDYTKLKDSASTAAVVQKLNDQKALLDTSISTMEKIRADIETPANGNLAEQLKNAADKYQKEYTNYATSKDAADRASENYNKIIAEIATRDATIDAVNEGVIDVTGFKNGAYTLSNGMTLKDGKFYQDGSQVFTNAAGVSQNGLEFTDASGNMVRYGADAGRQLSTTDVKNIFARDYGLNISDADASKFVGGSYTDYDATKFQDLALDRIESEFKAIAGREPTQAEANSFMNQDDAITTAQNEAINGLDLPEGYIPAGATQDQKVSFAQAFANARSTLGAGQTFEWNGKQYTTDTKEEATVKQFVEKATGDYEASDVNIVKARLGESIKLSNITGRYDEFNPADLTATEMNKFVDNFVKATPEQRAGLLRGADQMTYKVINDMLQGYAGTTERTSGQMYEAPVTFGSIKPSDMTNYTGILEAGTKNAAADLVGLGIRAAQTIASIAGYDTPTLNKMQDLLTEGKETRMNKLVGDERAVAGGIASGLESAITWTLGGPAAAVATLGGIAANNAWIEGSNAVIDNKGRTWNSAKEAQDNGVWTFKQLTPEENGLRTAVMASLEIAGEAIGIPGMSKLMKGIPITGDVGTLINAVKNFGVGLGNEQVSELLTTTAQMAADKYMSVGLGQNATFEDLKNALIDTAIATTAAVGTAGSISTATSNIRNTALNVNPFSTDLREGLADPTVASLSDIYKSYGIQPYDVNQIAVGIQNTIKNGGVGLDTIESRTAETLKNLGVTGIRADALADAMVDRVLNETLTNNLSALGLDQAQIDQALVPLKNDLINQVGTESFYDSVRDSLAGVDVDAQTVNQALTQIAGKQQAVTTTSTATQPIDTTTTAAAGTNAGLTTEQVQSLTNDIADAYSGSFDLTKEQISQVVAETISTMPAGVTSAQMEIAIQNAIGSFATKADIDAAIANIQLPAGLTKEDVSSAITEYMKENPGMTAEDVSNAVSDYMTANPGLTAADVDTAVSKAVKDFAIKSDIETAISNIQFPAGLTKEDVAASIKEYMEANPGLSMADVTSAIETYMKENPGLTKADVDTAISEAVSGLATSGSVSDVSGALTNLGTDLQSAFDSLSAAQKAEVESRVQMGENLETAIGEVAQSVTNLETNLNTTLENISGSITDLSTATQTAFETMTTAQQAEVAARVQMGENLETAINTVQENLTQNLTETRQEINQQITTLSEQTQTQYNQLSDNQKAEVAARIQMGENLETAINDVSTTLTGEIAGVKSDIEAEKQRQIAAQKAAAAESKKKELIAKSQALMAPITDEAKRKPLGFKEAFMTSEAKPGEFKGPLEEFLKKVESESYLKQQPTGQPMQPTQQQLVPQPLAGQQQQPTSPDQNYFSYGSASEIDSILNPMQGYGTAFTPFELGSKAGGLATPLMAAGGSPRGGLNMVNFAGKNRIDFRQGMAVSGPGDGQSDDIPAMLADGEFVFPADVVSALGNGSTKAGSDKLYDMMHAIRAHHRSAKPKDLPPPAKRSPLDYLADVPRKARR